MRRLNIILLLTVVLSIGFMVPPVLGETNRSTSTLSLQQAIELAIQHDKGLRKAELEVERTEKLREAAADKINFTPLMGSIYDETTQVNWNNLLSADLTWRMSKKSLEAERDSLVLKTCKSYWNVQTAQEKVALQEKLEQQAFINLQNVRAGLQAGTAAPYQMVEAEGSWQQAKNNLKAARQALEDAYNTFNQLVGLDTTERPLLMDEPVFDPLEVDNLDYMVRKVIEESPSTWLAQQEVTLQKWAADMALFTGEYNPYKARQIAVDQAELDAANAEDLMEKVTRNLYFTIKSLEESYKAAEEALKTARESLRIAKVKFDVGMATRAEVVSAEINVAQAEQALNDLTRQHAYLKLAFEKPWAASGSAQ